jgi:glycosyltransferase involved in cell wall biosynthesis
VSVRKRIHVINPLIDTTGGSEWRAVSLYRELRGVATATLWRFAAGTSDVFDVPSRAISAPKLQFPCGGTIVFVGVYFGIGRWIWLARPRRVILVYNTPDPERLDKHVRLVRRACRLEPEIVFCSEALAKGVPNTGTVETSIVDVDRFRPADRSHHMRFTVGRLSRATEEKHHPADLAFYERLLGASIAVDLLGATTTMIKSAPDHPDLRLRPAGEIAADQHLGSIDCFFYRTSPDWSEPWGRVVIEAMASGLPVLIERRTGASSVIEHGYNGFLFDSEDEAFNIIMRLKNDEALRAAIGAAARDSAVQIMSKDAKTAIRDFYLR